MSDELRALAQAARRLTVASAAYRRAIRAAHKAGHSLRAIAEAAGVSHQTVANLLARDD